MDIYNAIEYELKFFQKLKETMEKVPHRIIKIDELLQDQVADIKTICERIALLIEDMIETAEGVRISIPLDIIENEYKKYNNGGNGGREYILNVAKEIERRLLSASKDNLFCKTFVDRGSLKAIRQYVLLNAKLSGTQYVIQNDLIAIYNRIVYLLETYVTSESYVAIWDFSKGQPPTVKDLVDELSLLADHLLMQAMKNARVGGFSNAQCRESARLWDWNDILSKCLTLKTIIYDSSRF